MIIVTFLHNHDYLYYVFLACYMGKKSVYCVIGGPYVSDQASLNRGPLILNVIIVTLYKLFVRIE